MAGCANMQTVAIKYWTLKEWREAKVADAVERQEWAVSRRERLADEFECQTGYRSLEEMARADRKRLFDFYAARRRWWEPWNYPVSHPWYWVTMLSPLVLVPVYLCWVL